MKTAFDFRYFSQHSPRRSMNYGSLSAAFACPPTEIPPNIEIILSIRGNASRVGQIVTEIWIRPKITLIFYYG